MVKTDPTENVFVSEGKSDPVKLLLMLLCNIVIQLCVFATSAKSPRVLAANGGSARCKNSCKEGNALARTNKMQGFGV